jgi:pilus assembly protein CpaE
VLPRPRLQAAPGEPTRNAETAARSSHVQILLVEDVPQVAERIRELLRSQDTYKIVAVVSNGGHVERDVAEYRPDVVMVDTLLQGRVNGPSVIERLRRTRNPLPCVAITVADRPLPEAVAENVDAVVTFPAGTFDLIHAIRDSIAAGATRNPTLASRMVAVFSAKGGVGKTTIAYNLAVAMAQMGLRTALLDGNLQYGDVRRLLRVADDLPSICDLPTDSLRASDLGELMVSDPSGIEVLLAPPRLEMAELITTRDLDKILELLRRTYHAIVIDTSSSLGEATLAMLDAADVIVQVVTPETAALDVTRLAAQAFAGIGYPPSKIQLLLNRADTQGAVSRSQLRLAFGHDPDYVIGSDWALVAQSNAEGVPFVLANPDAAISASVREAAGQLASIVGAEPRESTPRLRRAGRA